MTLFLSLLPLYLFGNLHCIGMCGPLVMLLGQHHYRFFYFFGRLLSFSLAGFIAGGLGSILHLVLKKYYLAELMSFFCGILIINWGVRQLFGWKKNVSSYNENSISSHFHRWISRLMLQDKGWSTFLFGFMTIVLPCGQTLVVFSACALTGSAWIGLANGFAFALLTSPSLIVAMHALRIFKNSKRYDRFIIGCCSVLVGTIACCRGMAELGWISHWILNPEASDTYHIVIF